MSCKQKVSYSEAINLAERHASQTGLATELDFAEIFSSGEGGFEIDSETMFGIARFDFERLTSLTIDDAFKIAEKIPVLGDFAKDFGSIINKGVELFFGPQDSGVPGTDFYIDIKEKNQYANISSGAWAMLAKKYQDQGAYICTSKQSGYLKNLKRGYVALQLTPEQIDESRLFILMNLRPGADQPETTKQDAINFTNDLQSYAVSGVPQDHVTGSDIITEPYINDPNDPNDTNDILMYLGLGALLFFISKK